MTPVLQVPPSSLLNSSCFYTGTAAEKGLENGSQEDEMTSGGFFHEEEDATEEHVMQGKERIRYHHSYHR